MRFRRGLRHCARLRRRRQFLHRREQRLRVVGDLGLGLLRLGLRRGFDSLGCARARFRLRRFRLRVRLRPERLEQPVLAVCEFAAEVACRHQHRELHDEHEPERLAVLHRRECSREQTDGARADAEPAVQFDGLALVARGAEDPAAACSQRAQQRGHPREDRERRPIRRASFCCSLRLLDGQSSNRAQSLVRSWLLTAQPAEQRATELQRHDAEPESDRHVQQHGMQLAEQLHEDVLVHQRSIPFTTLPATSVSRKSRPSWR